MRYVYHDGGRKGAGFKGDAGDCVTRAIAIVTDRPYSEIYQELSDEIRAWLGGRTSKAKRHRLKKRSPYSPRNGVPNPVVKRYLDRLGFEWTPTMGIGTGCTVHLKDNELPEGRLVVRLTGHICAVMDRVVYDTYDPSRNDTRCVYGYWAWKGDQ